MMEIGSGGCRDQSLIAVCQGHIVFGRLHSRGVPQGSFGNEMEHHESGKDDRHDEFCGEGHRRTALPGAVGRARHDARNLLRHNGCFGSIGFMRAIDKVTMLVNDPGRLQPPGLVKGFEKAGKQAPCRT